MKKFCLLLVFCISTQFVFAQCTVFDATSCMCSDSVSTNCDLLPDIKIGLPPLYSQGNQGVIEYSQSGNGSNDGRLRVSVSTPNIGFGPLTVMTTTTYLCGTDTFTGTAPSQCPNGDPPSILVNQRVYHKNGNAMSYYDRAAGSMTYHPSHAHMHVDDWGIYTLRDSTPGEANPLNWPIIGTGSKLAFCLMDYGSCSTYAGHCTDDNGNTLLNGDFANYGLGGGSYGCSPTIQGITAGYTDIYYQYLDGMFINIPPGTCNGQYYIVIQLDPYDYFLESNENNNVVAVPYTLTQQTPNGASPSINTIGSTNVCQGSSIDLVASYGTSFLWSDGSTSQSISVTSAGDYYVTVSSSCGTGTSDTINISVIDPQITSFSHDTINAGQQATLSASSNLGNVKWFDAPVGGNKIHTGSTYQTSIINNSVSYYTEAVFNNQSASQFAPPHSNAIGSGAQHNTNSRYLNFDCHSPMVLESVKVYAFGAGNRTIELRNSSDVVLQTATFNLPDGESRIPLNFTIQNSSDYRLGLSAASSAALFRNNSGVNYPYQVNGFVDITGSSAGASYYYFFYDWEVRSVGDSCTSPTRSQVKAMVNMELSLDAQQNLLCNGDGTGALSISVIGGALPHTYSWSDGSSIEDRVGLSAGAYSVVVTDAEGMTESMSFTLTEPAPISITTSKSNVSCFGVGNGSVRVIATGGISPYSYSWDTNPVQTNTEITSLDGGIYSCITTDQNACTKVISVNINDPQELLVFSLPNNPGPGDINLLVTGGIAPYDYNWNTGSNNEDEFGLAPGFYFCQVADRNGCAKVHAVILSQPGNITVPDNGVIPSSTISDLDCKLFPNPVADKCELSIQTESAGRLTVEIFSSAGKKIQEIVNNVEVGETIFSLDVANLSSGVYLVKVNDNSQVQTLRFSKN